MGLTMATEQRPGPTSQGVGGQGCTCKGTGSTESPEQAIHELEGEQTQKGIGKQENARRTDEGHNKDEEDADGEEVYSSDRHPVDPRSERKVEKDGSFHCRVELLPRDQSPS